MHPTLCTTKLYSVGRYRMTLTAVTICLMVGSYRKHTTRPRRGFRRFVAILPQSNVVVDGFTNGDRKLHHRVSYYSSRCRYFGVLASSVSARPQTISITVRTIHNNGKTGATAIFLLSSIDVCGLFVCSLATSVFTVYTFHLTHFRNTSLAFSELFPSLQSVI